MIPQKHSHSIFKNNLIWNASYKEKHSKWSIFSKRNDSPPDAAWRRSDNSEIITQKSENHRSVFRLLKPFSSDNRNSKTNLPIILSFCSQNRKMRQQSSDNSKISAEKSETQATNPGKKPRPQTQTTTQATHAISLQQSSQSLPYPPSTPTHQ